MLVFTHLSRVVAVIALIVAVFFLFAAFQSWSIFDPAPPKMMTETYFRFGVSSLMAALSLGTLAEISFSLRKS